MDDPYNLIPNKPTTQEERHAASKRNKDFAPKAGSAGENTASKKEARQKGIATVSRLNQDIPSTPENSKINTSSEKEALGKDIAGSKY